MGVGWNIASFFIVFLVMAFLGYCYIHPLLPLTGGDSLQVGGFQGFFKICGTRVCAILLVCHALLLCRAIV